MNVIRTSIFLKIIITKKGAQVRKSEFQRNVGIIKLKDQLDIVAPLIINDSEWFLAELCQVPLLNMPKIDFVPL